MNELFRGGLSPFSVKGQLVSILSFAGHMDVTTTQLCSYSIKAVIDKINGNGCSPIKLYLPKQLMC